MLLGDKRKMTKEQIKEKAKDFVSKIAGGTSKEMDYCANILAEFATEVTKELEKENAELEKDKDYFSDALDKQIEATLKLQKENAELKNKLEHRNCLDCSNHSSNLRMRNLELEKENAELKETLKTYNGCGDWDNDFHTCRVYLQHEELQMYIEQITKAKEIIKKFSEFVNNGIEYDPEHPQEHTDLWNKLCTEAEQFLSEVEK